jgi:hypothetical protein
MSDTCDKCGKTEPGVGWIAKGFRKMELRHGRPDPGNLCGACAGSLTGKRLGEKWAAEFDS